MFYGTHYPCVLGDIFLASNEENIIGLWIGNQKYISKTKPKDIVIRDDIPVLKDGVSWLDSYFAGEKPDPFNLSLAPMGSEFRQLVWKILLEIPYGKTTTYGAIAKETAKRLNRERMSAQAVGGAIAHNPISIIIPCHRVIGADGSLTGYAGGVSVKEFLLTHEKAI